MKTGLSNYSKNDSNKYVREKADNLLDSLKTLKDKKKIAELRSEQEERLADIECSMKILNDDVAEEDRVEKVVLERPHTPDDKIKTAIFSDELSSILKLTEDENKSEEEFEFEESDYEKLDYEESDISVAETQSCNTDKKKKMNYRLPSCHFERWW
ncbi:hypothetical protein RCL_jg16622.t1 [Rhizophagus clarus]|uniref:Uncharacterized protein n=1 Tax=Rhizophagus clarus TaxID=94130 RepID=A0A8H3QQY2_9GLOM|nr:hypothetical protein RCL_jg16622.t1 [Rhizophagus clarus]